MVEKFHDYLYGVKFTVVTDNNPLTYVLTTGKLNATGHRWLAALATYDFEIKYRPGHTKLMRIYCQGAGMTYLLNHGNTCQMLK